MMSKVRKTYDIDKLSKQLAKSITKGLNELGKQININIGKNLNKGVDLKGNPHKALSPDSTIPIRLRRGQGTRPLTISGKLEQRKIKQATPSQPTFKIEMTGKGRKGFIYGQLHNQKDGYTTDPKSAIPNRKVPQRKWFGIPDSCKPGGKEYKKMVARVSLLNKIAFRK